MIGWHQVIVPHDDHLWSVGCRDLDLGSFERESQAWSTALAYVRNYRDRHVLIRVVGAGPESSWEVFEVQRLGNRIVKVRQATGEVVRTVVLY